MDRDEQIAGVASLAEPQRHALYRYVVRRADPVGRDEAARALGVPRSVAAFHLDRLVSDGLLETEYRRLTGRTGPGAGRPAKLYHRAVREISVQLPERRYALAADLLATAVTAAATGGTAVDGELAAAARAQGRRLAAAARDHLGRRRTSAAAVDAALAVLEDAGYEPRRVGDEVVMANCPFHALIDDHRTLVCGMNLDLLAGMVDDLPECALTAHLRPSDHACWVRLTIG